MKRFLIVAAIAVIVAPFVSADLLRVDGTRSGAYDMATGQMSAAGTPTRMGPSIWAATGYGGWFWGQAATEMWIDWGDVGTGPTLVDGFSFAYATNAPTGYAFGCWEGFLSPENGFGDPDFPIVIWDI